MFEGRLHAQSIKDFYSKITERGDFYLPSSTNGVALCKITMDALLVIDDGRFCRIS
jgi:hypothetical protein